MAVPYFIPNAFAYFNSVFVLFWTTHDYTTQAGSTAFPSQTLWIVSAIYQQSYTIRSEEHTSELQSPCNLVCRLLLEKKKRDSDARPTTCQSPYSSGSSALSPLSPPIHSSSQPSSCPSSIYTS